MPEPTLTLQPGIHNVHTALVSATRCSREVLAAGREETWPIPLRRKAVVRTTLALWVADLRFLHHLSASSSLCLAPQKESPPFSCLEARKSALKARYYTGLPQGCKRLMDVSPEVPGHAGFPAGRVCWEGDTKGSNKTWLLWHAHFEKHFFHSPSIIFGVSK